jgi:phosphate transport system substrate-binding protein
MTIRGGLASLVIATACVASSSCWAPAEDIRLQASGATFPAPLYKRWFLEYYKRHRDVRVNYTPIGSGAGIRQFTAGLVTFGASDAGMSKKEIDKLPKEFGGVKLLPMTAGSIVLSYNLPGVSEPVRLSRKAYLSIFLREITEWNHPEIQRHNPNLHLPETAITIVTRADSSGTTYAFTNHLNAVANDPRVAMKWLPGVDKSVTWKDSIAAQGNDGVAALIQLTPGAIGYLEYSYAELGHLSMAILENFTGRFVAPGPETSQKALAGAVIPQDLQIKVPDPPNNPDAYPIVTYTWLLCRARYTNATEAHALKKVVLYCLEDGQQISSALGYIPLPEEVVKKVKDALGEIQVIPVAGGASLAKVTLEQRLRFLCQLATLL